MSSPPLVSIVTATYNRSVALSYTLQSAIRSTFTDWELLVVGDACTDDTEQVVDSYADPRIQFLNLDTNTGEQSGPNNAGFDRSRGRFVAFLNHDDLWFPDHLETCLAGIEATGADLVFTLVNAVTADGLNLLLGATPTGRYEPYMHVPASSWLLRRELMQEVGPWRFYRECHNIPSQEWLCRATKAGQDLRLIPRLTVIALPSGSRKGSYLAKTADENRDYFERMCSQPSVRERQLTEIARWYASRDIRPDVIRLLGRGVINFFRRVCLPLGVSPRAAWHWVRYRRRGGAVDHKREIRGLPPRGRDARVPS